MLSDADIARLCRGRLVYAEVYQSAGQTPALEPHWAVILDSDEEVRANTSYYCVVISHDTKIDPDYLIPVPDYSGRTGYFQCGWIEEIHLPGITRIGQKIELPHLMQIDRMVRQAREAKKRQQRSTDA
jgi:hypothetical protein